LPSVAVDAELEYIEDELNQLQLEPAGKVAVGELKAGKLGLPFVEEPWVVVSGVAEAAPRQKLRPTDFGVVFLPVSRKDTWPRAS
jgi:hypothetical protein